MYFHNVHINGKFYPYATMDTMQKLKITDEIVKEWKTKNIVVRYNDEHFVLDFDCQKFKENDYVLDRLDGTCGIIEILRENGTCAINDNGTAEINVSINRLIKMKYVLSDKLKNISQKIGIFDL